MRASSFGGCIRAIVAEELGYVPLDPPPRMRAIFDAGNDSEIKALEVLAQKGWKITGQQDEVEFAGITGHIDGWDADTRAVIEIKSMGKEPYARWLDEGFEMGGLMERYKWQTSIYMHALGAGLVLVGYSRADEDVHIRTRTLPFHTEAAIRARVAEIERWVDLGELPGCEGKPDNYACPFLHLHVPEERDRDELVEGLGEQYRALSDSKGRVEQQIKDVRKLLEEAMGDRETVDCPNVKVTRYKQMGPVGVDRDQMKLDGVWEKYEVPGKEGWRLKVTLREVEGADKTPGVE